MTYTMFSRPWHRALAVLFLGLAVACGDGAEGTAGTGGSLVPIPQGCPVVLSEGEPDLIITPSVPQNVVLNPGAIVNFEVWVDEETRTVEATLIDGNRFSTPPGQPSSMPVTLMTLGTGGDESLAFAVPTTADMRGRYYADLVLCGDDCDALRVQYTLIEENLVGTVMYERIVYENDIQVRSELTCHRLLTVPLQPRQL